MSRGISIYYKMVNSDNENIWYGYSGVDQNKAYKEVDVLKYDGMLRLSKQLLDTDKVIDCLREGIIVIEKECKYENHHTRLVDNETGKEYGYFALKVASKVIRILQESGEFSIKDAIVF